MVNEVRVHGGMDDLNKTPNPNTLEVVHLEWLRQRMCLGHWNRPDKTLSMNEDNISAAVCQAISPMRAP